MLLSHSNDQAAILNFFPMWKHFPVSFFLISDILGVIGINWRGGMWNKSHTIFFFFFNFNIFLSLWHLYLHFRTKSESCVNWFFCRYNSTYFTKVLVEWVTRWRESAHPRPVWYFLLYLQKSQRQNKNNMLCNSLVYICTRIQAHYIFVLTRYDPQAINRRSCNSILTEYIE